MDNIDNYQTNSDNTAYNVDNNDIVVDRDNIKPLNDPECTHQKQDGSTTFVKDSDEIGDFVAWVCANCNRGVFLPADKQII